MFNSEPVHSAFLQNSWRTLIRGAGRTFFARCTLSLGTFQAVLKGLCMCSFNSRSNCANRFTVLIWQLEKWGYWEVKWLVYKNHKALRCGCQDFDTLPQSLWIASGLGIRPLGKKKNYCDNHFLFWTPAELVPILIIIAICGCLFPLKKSSLEGRVINKVCFISASGTELESRCVVPPPTPLSYIQCTWYIFRQIYLLRYSFCSHQFVFPASKLSNMHLSALMGVGTAPEYGYPGRTRTHCPDSRWHCWTLEWACSTDPDPASLNDSSRIRGLPPFLLFWLLLPATSWLIIDLGNRQTVHIS